MLGFGISVFRKGDEKAHIDKIKDLMLAEWETSVAGLDWLDELVKQNKAVDLGGNGYPLRYSVTAGVLFPILKAGLPGHNSPPVIGDDYMLPRGWNGKLRLNEEKFLACPIGETLIVEAWDLS
jgi:hypothetical protein